MGFAERYSLFWMGWTAYPSIFLWSPLLASTLFGHGFITNFITVYMYLIDIYEIYAASALTFITLARYTASSGMLAVGIPFYRNMGTHWTVTTFGAISVVSTPVPYLLYSLGPRIRSHYSPQTDGESTKESPSRPYQRNITETGTITLEVLQPFRAVVNSNLNPPHIGNMAI